MESRVACIQSPTGSHHLALIAKRAYRVHRGGCLPLRESPAFVEAARHTPSLNSPTELRLVADSDLFAPLKPSTDVLIDAAACARRGPVPCVDTAVRAGPLRKRIRAVGDRRLQLGAGGRLHFSEPAAFERLPLIWDHAYGGRDGHAERRGAHPRGGANARTDVIAYPRNAAGRGFYMDVDRERLEGTLAPNLEDPDDPITADRLLASSSLDWCDRPVAVAYGAVDWLSFPRVVHWLGVHYDRPRAPLFELRQGLLRPEDLPARPIGMPPAPQAYNCAPHGLFGARLTGAERVSLWNMHPQHDLWEVDLPGDRPKLALVPPGCPSFDVPALLQTVLVEPYEERITMTWTGMLEVAAPYSETMCQAMERGVRWER